MEGWPLNVQGSTFFINPFATDMNNDGILDLSGAGKDISNSDCFIYLWNANVAFNEEKSILPILQYNAQHDGVYRDPLALDASFSGNPLELNEGGSVQFTDLSAGSVISWSWSFEGGNPATSDEQNPEVLYENTGNWDVTLNISDGTENDIIIKQDYITVNSATSINNYEGQQLFSVFPNPVRSKLHIRSLKLSVQGEKTIKVFDNYGQQLKEINIPVKTENISIDVDDWKSGLYFLSLIVNGENAASTKVVVK